MKRIVIISVSSLFAIVIVYVGFSFYEISFDCRGWPKEIRFAFVIVASWLSAMVGGFSWIATTKDK